MPLIGVKQPSATTRIVVIPLLKSFSKAFPHFVFGGGLPSHVTKNTLVASHEGQDHHVFHGTYALRASPLCHFWAPQNIRKWSFDF